MFVDTSSMSRPGLQRFRNFYNVIRKVWKPTASEGGDYPIWLVPGIIQTCKMRCESPPYDGYPSAYFGECIGYVSAVLPGLKVKSPIGFLSKGSKNLPMEVFTQTPFGKSIFPSGKFEFTLKPEFDVDYLTLEDASLASWEKDDSMGIVLENQSEAKLKNVRAIFKGEDGNSADVTCLIATGFELLKSPRIESLMKRVFEFVLQQKNPDILNAISDEEILAQVSEKLDTITSKEVDDTLDELEDAYTTDFLYDVFGGYSPIDDPDDLKVLNDEEKNELLEYIKERDDYKELVKKTKLYQNLFGDSDASIWHSDSPIIDLIGRGDDGTQFGAPITNSQILQEYRTDAVIPDETFKKVLSIIIKKEQIIEFKDKIQGGKDLNFKKGSSFFIHTNSSDSILSSKLTSFQSGKLNLFLTSEPAVSERHSSNGFLPTTYSTSNAPLEPEEEKIDGEFHLCGEITNTYIQHLYPQDYIIDFHQFPKSSNKPQEGKTQLQKCLMKFYGAEGINYTFIGGWVFNTLKSFENFVWDEDGEERIKKEIEEWKEQNKSEEQKIAEFDEKHGEGSWERTQSIKQGLKNLKQRLKEVKSAKKRMIEKNEELLESAPDNQLDVSLDELNEMKEMIEQVKARRRKG